MRISGGEEVEDTQSLEASATMAAFRALFRTARASSPWYPRAFHGATSGISKVCVVGAGTLGTQVALQAAISGFEVTVLDVSASALSGCHDVHETLAQSFVLREMDHNQARGWAALTTAQNLDAETVAERALKRLSYTTSAEEAMAKCDLVSENVPEVPEIKQATYDSLKGFAADHTIFTTNSST